MNMLIRLLIALAGVAWTSWAPAAQMRVIINLSEQRVYLLEGGSVTLISPIASGKPGWSTPTGNFKIFSKDIDHRSRSFGSVIDASARVVNSNATPHSHVPAGCHYRPAPMPYFMEFSPAVGMHAGYLPGYPASHGCVRMPRDSAAEFFERVHTGTPVTVVGSTQNLTRVRKAIPILSSRSPVSGRHLSIDRLVLAPVSWISRSPQH
jgi:lipoprotein-anchoring transpeptidase ErfK/SrfK